MDINGIDRIGPTIVPDPVQRTPEASGLADLVTRVQAANRAELFGQDRELTFLRDDSTKQPVIAIRDRTTGEVLEEIPPKQLRQMLQDLRRAKRQSEDL